ncbi:MAG: hypothetical protein ACLQOO_04500 [Terriglobia bacterium]
MILKLFLTKSVSRRTSGVLNLKGLTDHVSGERRTDLFGFCRASETWRGLSIDSTLVVVQVAEGNRGTLAQSKGVAIRSSAGYRATLSGPVGRVKRGEAYLLIPRQLLAKLVSRMDEGLLNLKDLLTVRPPRVKGIFENDPVLKHSLATKSYQILPFPTKNVQRTGSNMAQNRGSKGLSQKAVESHDPCQAEL